MIRKADIVAMVAVGLMAGGCTQTDDVQPGKGVPIRLTATVDGDRAVGSRTATRSGSTTSTTQDTELLDGQTVDAYIQEKGGDWLARPAACMVDGTEGALTYSSDIYYPMDATPVEIYAVHPRYASAATFTVSSDQTDADNYAASDLCYSKTAEYSRSESAQTLVFSHVLSKIVVNVDMSALGGSHTVSNLRLKAKTQTTMTYPVDNTNGYTLGTAATPASIAMNEGGAVIIPPQTTAADGDVRISFDVSGIGPIVYEFPASTEFASNTQYTYTVKVGNTVTVTSSITAWGSQVNKSKTVEIGRPKLPIEYCAEYNMYNDNTMASNHLKANCKFYNESTSLSTFDKHISITGMSGTYHLPSVYEMNALAPYQALKFDEEQFVQSGLDAEQVQWGKKSDDSFEVPLQNFYNEFASSTSFFTSNEYTAYAIRLKAADIPGPDGYGPYTCAYRYTYFVADPECSNNPSLHIKVRYLGQYSTVELGDITNSAFWEESGTEYLERIFPAFGFYSPEWYYTNTVYYRTSTLDETFPTYKNYYNLVYRNSCISTSYITNTQYYTAIRLFKDAE